MIVIADSSPINILIRIGLIDLLPKLFKEVVIPEEVRLELQSSRTPTIIRDFMQQLPAWLVVRESPGTPRLPGIDAGEAAAIQLALKHKVHVILMDDWDGRRVAVAQGLQVIGTIGVLEQAAVAALIDFPTAIEKLKATDFRVDARLIAEALERDAQRKQ